jgi:formate dehydrogenase assembly factor FdhD
MAISKGATSVVKVPVVMAVSAPVEWSIEKAERPFVPVALPLFVT